MYTASASERKQQRGVAVIFQGTAGGGGGTSENFVSETSFRYDTKPHAVTHPIKPMTGEPLDDTAADSISERMTPAHAAWA
jgi:hypothetical protein